MKLFTTCLFVALFFGSAPEAQAKELAYVDWSRSMGEDPEYWGYKAFDDQKQTAWCSGPDGVGDVLTAGFLGDQIVDEIGVIAGAVDKKGVLDKSKARVRELRVSDGLTQQIFQLADKPGLQFVRINPALNAQRMTFTVEKVYFGERRSSPVCISSIVLRKSGTKLNGSKTAARIRGLKKNKQALLHLWMDAPGAPERYLTFSMTGRFSWVFAPILEGKPAKIKGHWNRKGDKLYLIPDHGKSASLKISLGRVADGDRIYQQLLIEGKAPHPKFSATYQAGGKE